MRVFFWFVFFGVVGPNASTKKKNLRDIYIFSFFFVFCSHTLSGVGNLLRSFGGPRFLHSESKAKRRLCHQMLALVYSTFWFGSVRFWFGSVLLCLVWFGMVWFGSVRFVMVWFGVYGQQLRSRKVCQNAPFRRVSGALWVCCFAICRVGEGRVSFRARRPYGTLTR